MIIDTEHGQFELITNHKEAFDIAKFNARYIDTLDTYDYIVGDVASELLRLKGFTTDQNDKHYFKYIPDYVNESCNYQCAFYILKRIKS